MYVRFLMRREKNKVMNNLFNPFTETEINNEIAVMFSAFDSSSYVCSEQQLKKPVVETLL